MYWKLNTEHCESRFLWSLETSILDQQEILGTHQATSYYFSEEQQEPSVGIFPPQVSSEASGLYLCKVLVI